MYNFKDQVVIVTGGTRGIGKGISKTFLESGATVLATYAGNDVAAATFKEELIQYGEKLETYKFDVSKSHECESFFKTINDIRVPSQNTV